MPARTKITSSDDEFIEELKTLGIHGTARKYAVYPSAVGNRRLRLEAKRGIRIQPRKARGLPVELNYRLEHDIKNGTVLVGSDAHLWPGEPTPAWQFFVKFAGDLKPDVLILNGDVLDFPQISKHSPIGWETQPTVQDELENAQEQLHKLAEAAGKSARKLWPAGNHDLRFETRLASHLPEYKGIKGIHLKDHFPAWEPCWQVWLNGNVQVKHRWKGGDHAGHNNTLRAGNTILTGHDHQLKVTPWNDSNGVRWGVQTGTLADPLFGPQFTHYTEDNPRNWVPGFILLTFKDGELLWPETIHVTSRTTATFRGQQISL